MHTFPPHAMKFLPSSCVWSLGVSGFIAVVRLMPVSQPSIEEEIELAPKTLLVPALLIALFGAT